MKKMWIGIAIFILAVLLIVIVATQTGKQAEELRIGTIAPLTGNNAVYGAALKNGIDLAINEINAKGGVGGRRLGLVVEDSQADPQKGVSAFRKLTTVDRVPMVMGAMFSAVTLAIAPIAEEQKVVLLSPTSSAVELTEAGDYIFRIYPSDSYDGKFLANFAIDKLKAKTVSILYIQVASVTAITKVFRQTFEHRGGKVLEVEGYNEGETDFRGALLRIKESNPDLIFMPSYLREMAIQLRQAKEMGLKQQILTISTFYDPKVFELAGDAANSVIFSTPVFDPASQDPVTKKFVDTFAEKYGSSPNIWAAYGYDVAKISALAIRKALEKGELTPETIKEELYKVQGYHGVTGITSFDQNGDVEKELKILKAVDEKFIDY